MGGIHTIMFIGMNARIDEHLINYADFYETGLEFFKEQESIQRITGFVDKPLPISKQICLKPL